ADGVMMVVVADGMGGHVGGEIASRIAIDAAVAAEGSVSDRIAAANHAILAEVGTRPELAGMGTTMTMLEGHPDGQGWIGHIGDSRAYLLRDGTLSQITEDHTIVTEYLRTGKITEDQAADHPQRHMLTRALGLVHGVDVDTIPLLLRPGDRVLLCSDGVNNMLTDQEIADALGAATAEEAAWELVERANRAGGHDNVTALVVDVEE
ncbi:MAG: protein phosphatase 2C domain-containing protein, partial [Acidimicrobiia bacterium]|nr:protein phosphatase 2C domain-containing protein [Acidimicrobiia bacterium]